MKFTALTIRQLQPKQKRYMVFEEGGGGFAIRVNASGTMTYVLVYRYQNKHRYYTIGVVDMISLKEARAKVKEILYQLEKGLDPATEKQLAATKELTDPTVAMLVDEYIEKWAKVRKKSWQEDQRILNLDVLPLWKNRKASSIKRREVNLLLESIVERGARIAANRTLSVIRRMYNFAVERDILETTPCLGIKAPAKETQRDRMLSKTELKIFWEKLDQAKMSLEVQLLLKLLLITAQRLGELVTARWPEINIQEQLWTISGTKAKNGYEHYVHLSPPATELLQELKQLHPDSEWLFPSPFKDVHITPEAVARAVVRSQETFNEIKAFTPHDLRRTAASHMTAIGIPRLVVSKILNHTETSVTAIYDRHSYDIEKKQALVKWGNYLTNLISEPINQ